MNALSLNDKSQLVPEMPIWRLSVAQYHEMIRTGILTEDDRIELLEGLLVTQMTKNPPHSLATQLIRDMLAQLISGNFFVSDQEPLTTEDSEPEPDVMVVRGKRRDYAEKHPASADVLLVVEVADSTLQRDKTIKLGIYAQAKISSYWLLNLPERQLEVYTNPKESGYEQKQIYHESESFDFWFEGLNLGQISVKAILP
jgi:Uma2 family endonuclease